MSASILFLLQSSEKRKTLVDEMAISVQTKSDEVSELQAKLQKAEEEAAAAQEVLFLGINVYSLAQPLYEKLYV